MRKGAFMRKFLFVLLIVFCFVGLFISSSPVMAADDPEAITLTVYIVGENHPFTVTINPHEYIGNIKLYIQDQTDVDLNTLDLMHDNGHNNRLLLETKNFYYYNIKDGQTITSQVSSNWTFDTVNGVENTTFTVARPIESNLVVVNANSTFGISPNNYSNATEFQDAMDYCKKNPGTKLVIDPGVYYFRGMTADFALNNLENIIIDGQGAEFLFDRQYCFGLTACNGVEIRNLIIDWDWDSSRLGSIVRIENVSPHNYDVRFLELDDVPEDIDFASFILYDADELIPGSHGEYRGYSPWQDPASIVNKEKIAPNVFHIEHNGHMYMFEEGDVYILRHYVYSGRAFSTVHYSKNITFNNVKIYGFSGMGWVFSDKTNHFQIINSYLGLRPGEEDNRRISTAADAIHIVNTGGYFRLDNNDLSFNGDDIINVHDDVLIISDFDDSRTQLTGWVTGGFVGVGDKVGFRNAQMGQFTDYEATVVSFSRDSETNVAVVQFAEPLPDDILAGYYVYNASYNSGNYVITNNYIHETKGRAVILNSDNALFANNYMYRTVSESVHVRSVVTTGRWTGGIGTNNVYILNNTFEECNWGSKGPVIEIGIDIDGYSPPVDVMTNIHIQDNQFISCIHNETQNAIDVKNTSASDLIITGNTLVDSGIINTNGILTEEQVAATNSIDAEPNEDGGDDAGENHPAVTPEDTTPTGTLAKPSTVPTNTPTSSTATPTPTVDPEAVRRDQVKAFVARMYTVALGRGYDEKGLNDWTDALLEHRINGAGIAFGFIESAEFKNKALSDEQYIDILYATFFDRPADPAGKQTWIDILQSGQSREYVLAGFVNSVEFDNLSDRFGIIRGYMFEDGTPANAGIYEFTERMYTKVLNRAAEKQGLNDWAMSIITGQFQPVQVARLFFESQEFLNRNLSNEDYVETLYQTFMGRSSDPDGKTMWVNMLNTNQMTRAEVLDGFAGSLEFKNILIGFGI